MAAVFEKWVTSADKVLHEKSAFTDYLQKLETKTGLPRLKLVGGAVVFLALYLMVGYGSDFICNAVGFAYPAYKSIKAIETKRKDDDTKWLTYWVVYGLFLLVECLTDLFLSWVPVYWFLKCVFLVFCMLPEPYNGSIIIYQRVVRPLFKKHHTRIDQGLDQASEMGRALISEARGVLEDTATDVVKAHLSEGTSVAREGQKEE